MRQTVQGRYVRRPTRRTTRRVPRNRRKPNYGLLAGLFFLAAVVSGGASFALQTPQLQVREIKVSGVRLSDSKQVESAARLALGRNIILLRKSEVLDHVSRIPEVRTVKMGRAFPDKVWVRVTERRPDAILTDNRTHCMVQLDGLMFHQVNGPRRGLPTIQIAQCGPLTEGRKCKQQCVKFALSALACARRERLTVRKISVDPLGDMCLNMEDGFYVRLGQPDEIALKMSILRTALVCRPSIGREAVYIDLSCPSAPVWKPKLLAGAAS